MANMAGKKQRLEEEYQGGEEQDGRCSLSGAADRQWQ